MRYLSNAFSLNMLSEMTSSATLRVEPYTAEQAKQWVNCLFWLSAVGHENTARLFGNLLDNHVACPRLTVTLQPGDEMLVGQYSGPRLPEGATTLPEGAKIVWFLVKVVA